MYEMTCHQTSDGCETAKSVRTVDVCMKIQYPGVARSIHSDIDNLMRLVSLTDLLPRGLYVEHAVKVAKAGAQRGRGNGDGAVALATNEATTMRVSITTKAFFQANT